MAKFYRHKNGIGWLKITWLELAKYSENMIPVCDECLKDLIGFSNIVLLPILNEAYCPECGKQVLNRIQSYHPEDRPIAKRREEFYLNYFGIEEDRPGATETASSKNIYPQFTNRDSNCQDAEGVSECQKN